jgi:transcription antitermination protein NusB
MAAIPRSKDDGAAARKAEPTSRVLSAARLAAAQALYQVEMTGAAPETVLAEFLHHRQGAELGEEEGTAALDADLLTELLQGTVRERAAIDAAISALLPPDWPLQRIEKVMAALLRAAAYELVWRPSVPARVVISEYVDLAHAFYQGKEIGMVNGVLDRLARLQRPAEMEEAGPGEDRGRGGKNPGTG